MAQIYVFLLVFGIFGTTETVNFDSFRAGTIPPYWTSTMTHQGKPPLWAVAPDPSAPSGRKVFAQLSNAAGRYRFPLAIYDKVVCRDGDLSAKFKLVRGRESATAGIVWRFQDPNNYYYMHFSADQKNIGLYLMKDGRPQSIPVITGGDPKAAEFSHEIRQDQWYVVRVNFKGSRIKVWFGNRKLFEAEDSGIAGPGKTGLWTKADTIAYFDDFHIDKKS